MPVERLNPSPAQPITRATATPTAIVPSCPVCSRVRSRSMHRWMFVGHFLFPLRRRIGKSTRPGWGRRIKATPTTRSAECRSQRTSAPSDPPERPPESAAAQHCNTSRPRTAWFPGCWLIPLFLYHGPAGLISEVQLMSQVPKVPELTRLIAHSHLPHCRMRLQGPFGGHMPAEAVVVDQRCRRAHAGHAEDPRPSP